MIEPKPGELYRHFKGGEYKIVCVSRDCDCPKKKRVSYEQLYDKEDYPKGTRWDRSLE